MAPGCHTESGTQAMENVSEVIHPDFETKVDITKSPTQEKKWLNKRD